MNVVKDLHVNKLTLNRFGFLLTHHMCLAGWVARDSDAKKTVVTGEQYRKVEINRDAERPDLI